MKSQIKRFEDIYLEWYNTAYKGEVKEQSRTRMNSDYLRFVDGTEFAKKKKYITENLMDFATFSKANIDAPKQRLGRENFH